MGREGLGLNRTKSKHKHKKGLVKSASFCYNGSVDNQQLSTPIPFYV